MDLHLIFTLVSLVISSCVFFYFLKQLITGSNEPSTEGSEADQDDGRHFYAAEGAQATTGETEAKANDDDAVAPNAQPKETGTGEMERPAEAKPPAPEDDTAEDNGGKAVQRKESTRRKTKIKREE
jgi:hypothetical protein|uniref:Uncharacterized protein n=1 Tax=Eutreptiella gymnastica TaxID=73025 RepID=A0A7S4FL16_9EUGL